MEANNLLSAEKRCNRSSRGWFHLGVGTELELMSSEGVRMLHRGVPQPLDSRKVAVVLVIVMLLPILPRSQPMNQSVETISGPCSNGERSY